MNMLPLKPYLLRAYYEWICDSQKTPHLLVQANLPHVRVPTEYIDLDDDSILLNVSPMATNDFLMGESAIYFQARFNGVVWDVQVPYFAVLGLYAEENEQGIMFDVDMTEVKREAKNFDSERKMHSADKASQLSGTNKKLTAPSYLRVVKPEE